MKNEKYTARVIEDIIEENRDVYEKFEENLSKGIIVHGIGSRGKWAVEYLLGEGVNVRYIVDKDESMWKTSFRGVEIVGPNDDRIKEYPYVLITPIYAMEKIRESYNENVVTIPFFCFYVMRNYAEFCDVRDNYMEDEYSKCVYNAILYSMLLGNEKGCADVFEGNTYFSVPEFAGINGVEKEIYVDAGAYAGETIEKFVFDKLGLIEHIYAFEPGVKQYRALEKRMKRICDEWAIDEDKVTLIRGGVGAKNCRMYVSQSESQVLSAMSLAEKPAENDDVIDVYSLDEFLQGKKVTFIKADIEGMELDMLSGAKNTISNYKPKIALSAYHHPCDLFCIVKHLKNINPDYKFKLRAHSPYMVDYVLYCY